HNKKAPREEAGHQAAPSLAKGVSEQRLGAGFLTDGLPSVPSPDAQTDAAELRRCSDPLQASSRLPNQDRPFPAQPLSSSLFVHGPVGVLANQQRRPITVAGPWPIFAAFPLPSVQPKKLHERSPQPADCQLGVYARGYRVSIRAGRTSFRPRRGYGRRRRPSERRRSTSGPRRAPA